MALTANHQASPSHHIAYRPEIDGLRALAVTLVILVHAFPKYLQNGYIGVDIFFVISGFLITGILLAQLRDGSFSLRDFYIRRANRLFPALIALLIACIGFGWLALTANEFKMLGRSIAAGAGFLANINFLSEGGYWDISAVLKPLLHLWSLGVEEQFYLAWPLLLWAVWKWRFNLPLVLGGVISVSLIWNLRSTVVNQPAAFYLPFSRFWELLAGGALAYATILPSERMRMHGASKSSILSVGPVVSHIIRGMSPDVYAYMGLALIITALVQNYSPEDFPGWHAIPPVLGTVLIIAAGSKAWLNSRLFSNSGVVYVGLISFPLYIWHWPLLTFARILDNGELSAGSRNVALVLTVALAMATYHLLERPIRLNPSRRGLKAVVLVGLLGICGVVGYYIYKRDGLETRYRRQTKIAATFVPPSDNSKFRTALIGDSQAGVFAATIPAQAGKLVAFTAPGWPFLIGTEYREDSEVRKSLSGTPKLTEDTLARIVSDPTIDIVILSDMYAMYMDQQLLRSVTPSPQETSAMAYEAGLRRTLKFLTDAGKRVIYVKSVPFLRNVRSIEACSAGSLPIPRKQPNDCLVPIGEVKKQRESYDSAVSHAVEGLLGVYVFDPVPYLCDERYCFVEKDGVIMYQNTSHLSRIGGYIVGTELLKHVDRLRRNVHDANERP